MSSDCWVLACTQANGDDEEEEDDAESLEPDSGELVVVATAKHVGNITMHTQTNLLPCQQKKGWLTT